MRRRYLAGWGLALAVLALAAPASAHRMRPSHLSLSPATEGGWDIVWSVAFARGKPLPLELVLPARCARKGRVSAADSDTVHATRWRVDCGAKGLRGATVRVEGLTEAGTDVVVSVKDAPGEARTVVLNADRPAFEVGATTSGPGTGALAFVPIGVKHILLGADHLLFVLGLVVLVGRRRRMLLSTITSFTLAHSITLALAATGTVAFPTRAVEAIIALSILLLAWELTQPRVAGGSWTARLPWVFAFVCGLLHGFGFAGALSQIGLPAGQVPASLLLFNVGVELGQLAFVAAVLLVVAAGRWALPASRRWARPAAAYGLGGVSAYWVIQRATPLILG